MRFWRRELCAAGAMLLVSILGTGFSAAQSVDTSTTSTSESSTTSESSANLSVTSDTTSNVSLAGIVAITGEIVVEQSSMAFVDNTQIVSDNSLEISDSVNNNATLTDDLSANATGNIGINIAAGDMNSQDNAASIASEGAVGPGIASDASSLIVQIGQSNDLLVVNDNVVNQAILGGSALAGAQGNIGANITVGVFNIQKNAMTVSSVSTDTVLASAAASVNQSVSQTTTTLAAGATNIVHVGGSVMVGASGNIGLNISAGNNNLQTNSLNIASGN